MPQELTLSIDHRPGTPFQIVTVTGSMGWGMGIDFPSLAAARSVCEAIAKALPDVQVTIREPA